MRESSKTMRRRWCEDATGFFPWREIFVGKGLDVGAGNDALPFPDCTPFDQADGDANRLSSYFPRGSFDYLHGSQVLEHMHDPVAALRDWLSLVRPGGHIIQTVPDWVAYEGMQWPSRYNGDHKSSWSLLYRGSPAPIHIYLPDYLAAFAPVATVRLALFRDTNYDYNTGTSRDQTFDEMENVECWNEFVLQKL